MYINITIQMGGGEQSLDSKNTAMLNYSSIFIKIDIEGEELHALFGMQQIIKHYHPTLAISVYHGISDFYTIPQYILSLYKNYRIYFRHYSQGLIESVMFFIPLGVN